MHGGTCPSCGDREVYASRNGLALGEYAFADLRPNVEPGFRGALSNHRSDQLWTYLCAACGLVEFRLHDAAGIDFARQTWVRVTDPPRDT